MKLKATKIKGFTLIELLVVIAIISLLSSVVLSQLNETRAKTRDATRFYDFQQFAVALELFYTEHGVYPCGDNGGGSSGRYDRTGSGSFLDGNGTGGPVFSGFCESPPFIGIQTGGYYPDVVIKDPLQSASYTYHYQIDSDRKSYILVTILEKDDFKMANDGGLEDNCYEFGPGVGVIPIVDSGTLCP